MTNISIIPWLIPATMSVNKYSSAYSMLGAVFGAAQTVGVKGMSSLFSRDARPTVECALEVSNGVLWWK